MAFMTFIDMLRHAAWRQPDRTFIYWSDRKKSITYAEGDEISSRVAGALSSLGVRKGDRVGIFEHNGLDYVTAMFGIWKLGAISAHISVLQKDNLAYFVHDSMPKVMIYTGDMHPVMENLRTIVRKSKNISVWILRWISPIPGQTWSVRPNLSAESRWMRWTVHTSPIPQALPVLPRVPSLPTDTQPGQPIPSRNGWI